MLPGITPQVRMYVRTQAVEHKNGILFLKTRKWMQDMLQRHVIPYGDAENIVVYEQAHFRGGAATELCVGLQTRAQD